MDFAKWIYIDDMCGDEHVTVNILCTSQKEFDKVIAEAKKQNKTIISII